jgi:glycosyltransferase involved in cell wall biosynthesis
MNQQNAAIYYKPDGYTTQSKRLLGRQAAGEGFLKAYVQYSQVDKFYCYTTTEGEFNHFQQLVTPWLKKPIPLQWLPNPNLEQIGNLYLPSPNLASFAWQRRFGNQRGYSICGVTHTIASKEIIANIGDLLIAPIQPWDALICTSNAVKTAVNKILNDWSEYLAQRFNSDISPKIKLSIIPLGVDSDSFKPNPQFRQNLRQNLNIKPEDIVVLFVGRLIFYAKGHPVPMYLALEKAISQINNKNKIHLIQCGWFEDEREELAFKQSAVQFSPSINHIFLDGRNPEIRQQIWSSADIFISLSDNIQETFGLTPIEAMAAGLPCIVSDWNGYQESVRNGIDGFRITTLIPPPNSGLDLAYHYQSDQLNYSTYIAHSSLSTMVDIDECTAALVDLIDNSDLRTEMGKNGQLRAKNVYDWQNVIKSYQELWQELAEIRNTKEMEVPVKKGSIYHPLCDDPFNLFAHYPTQILTPETVLRLGAIIDTNFLNQIRNNWITNFGASYRLSDEIINKIIVDLQTHNKLNVAYFIAVYGQQNSGILMRTLGYLLKFNLIQIEHLKN